MQPGKELVCCTQHHLHSTSSSSPRCTCASQRWWPPSNTSTMGSSLHGASGWGIWEMNLTGGTFLLSAHHCLQVMERLYPPSDHNVMHLFHLTEDRRAQSRACSEAQPVCFHLVCCSGRFGSPGPKYTASPQHLITQCRVLAKCLLQYTRNAKLSVQTMMFEEE